MLRALWLKKSRVMEIIPLYPVKKQTTIQMFFPFQYLQLQFLHVTLRELPSLSFQRGLEPEEPLDHAGPWVEVSPRPEPNIVSTGTSRDMTHFQGFHVGFQENDGQMMNNVNGSSIFPYFPNLFCAVLKRVAMHWKSQVNQLMLAPQLAVAAAWHEGGTLLDLDL